MQPDSSFRIRRIRFDELDRRTLDSWESLEERAMESNAFLSPRFVVPAIRHLERPADISKLVFVFVERTHCNTVDLVGAGVFVHSRGTKRFPVPHLQAYRSCHSYLSGLLVDKDEAEGVVQSFFRFFSSQVPPCHGIEFAYRPAEGPQASLIATVAANLEANWYEHSTCRRAIFLPSEGGEDFVRAHLSKKRAQDLRRVRRRLEENGKVEWCALFDEDVSESTVQRFLDLEHMGWKGKHGTSLRSHPANEAFFLEMIDGFRNAGRLLFTVLYLEGSAIACAIDLISGHAGFGFKLGSDPYYAKMAPGLLNQIEFIRHAPSLCDDLSYIDSGSSEGSFMDEIWVNRRVLSSGIFGTTPMGNKVLSGVDRLRRIRGWVHSIGESANGEARNS
jgi:hypothetical protein